MRRPRGFLLLVMVWIVVAAQQQALGPRIRTVEPSAVAPGELVTLTGENLGKNYVSGGTMDNGAAQKSLKVTAHTENSIQFKMKAVRPGRYFVGLRLRGRGGDYLAHSEPLRVLPDLQKTPQGVVKWGANTKVILVTVYPCFSPISEGACRGGESRDAWNQKRAETISGLMLQHLNKLGYQVSPGPFVMKPQADWRPKRAERKTWTPRLKSAGAEAVLWLNVEFEYAVSAREVKVLRLDGSIGRDLADVGFVETLTVARLWSSLETVEGKQVVGDIRWRWSDYHRLRSFTPTTFNRAGTLPGWTIHYDAYNFEETEDDLLTMIAENEAPRYGRAAQPR